MRNKIFGIILIFASAQCSAQTMVGVKSGPDLTFIWGNDFANRNYSTINFNAGFFVEKKFLSNSPFTFRAELSYDKKGVKSEEYLLTDSNGQPTGGSLVGYSKFTYLTVPILCKYYLKTQSNIYLEGGVFGGYLLKHYDVTSITGKVDTETDGTNNFHRMDFGVSIGGGVKFPISESLYLMAELRETLGLFNISKIRIINDQSIKTSSTGLTISIGYKL